MARALVVYYSRTGTTKSVARRIADALGADVEELVDRTPRRGLRGFLRSGRDAMLHRLTTLEPTRFEPRDYDVVIVASPVWSASVSTPVRTWLRHHRASLDDVAFVCTCGGRGGIRAIDQMARVAGRPPSAMLVLREREVARGAIATELERFVRAVRATIAAPKPTNGQPIGERIGVAVSQEARVATP